jgi:hypothetical protein
MTDWQKIALSNAVALGLALATAAIVFQAQLASLDRGNEALGESVVRIERATERMLEVPERLARVEEAAVGLRRTNDRHENWLSTLKEFTSGHVQDSLIHSTRNRP